MRPTEKGIAINKRNALKGILLLLFGSISPPSASAAISAPEPDAFGIQRLGVRGLVSGSLGSMTVLESASAPTLIHYTFRAQADFRVLGPVSAGAEIGFSWINQLSRLEFEVGNRRGTAWWIGLPSLATRIGPVLTQLSFQFLGNYSLAADTVHGGELDFVSPLGLHFSGTIPLASLWASSPERIRVGIVFDWTRFAAAKVAPDWEVGLAKSPELWSLGFTAGWAF